MTVGTLMTAEELLQLPDDGARYELVRGELRKMSPSGTRHTRVGARIVASLLPFVEDHGLGAVHQADGGFLISRGPDTVRSPDAAFIRAERAFNSDGFFEGPPDVAFEVISPNDRYTEIAEKTAEWLSAGTRAVVLVDPRRETVHIHRANEVITVTDAIALDDIIPGWTLPLAKLFAR